MLAGGVSLLKGLWEEDSSIEFQGHLASSSNIGMGETSASEMRDELS